MHNEQLIIPHSQIDEVSERFYPFKEMNDDDDDLTIDTSEKSLENSEQLAEYDEKIAELKNEISFLKRTKENLENDLRIREESKNHLIAEEERLKQQAQANAENIISEAKKQAEDIKVKGEKEKNELIEDTNKQREEITATAKKQGFQEGFEKGFAKGESEREEVETYLKKILAEAIRKKDQVIDSIREHLVDLVFTAVKKVVKNITEADRKVVLRNIIDSLKQIDAPVKLTIKVNYEDLKASNTLKAQLLKSLETLKQVEILADPNIEKGGCIVETDFTIVDARISTQLDKIGNALNAMELVSQKK